MYLLSHSGSAAVQDSDQIKEEYLLHSDTLPDDARFMPSIGNGHIATNVLSDTIYMNAVFNGYLDDSHRARIPSTVAINVDFGDTTDTHKFTLDMYKGVFIQEIEHSSCNVSMKYFAHREMTRIMVAQVTVFRKMPGDITVPLTLNNGSDSMDMQLMTEDASLGVRYTSGYNVRPETNDSAPTHIHQYWTTVPSSVTLQTENDVTTWTFITSLSTDKADALQMFNRAVGIPGDELYSAHLKAWADLWNEGSIEVGGNMELSREIHSCLYQILSSTPSKSDQINPFIGLSPGGLPRGGKVMMNKTSGAYNDYAGHVFWDMDTWIMPPIMMLHPQMASHMIGARTRVLETAKANARETGYEGARFPWEEAVTGIETCPWPPASKYQIHVTADVSYALRQYLYATGDRSILTERRGFDLAVEIARFWKSRCHKNKEDKFEIHGVMGPDEYHFNINNSVFTNYNAKLSLMLPELLLEDYKISVNNSLKHEIKEFSDVAKSMYLLFDETKRYHPQFEGFGLNESIKQSDVVLLGYPFMMPMTSDVRRNDLEIYSSITDRFGPDTGTWSMHTVGWLELKDEEKAASSFQMMFRNINGPFKVFSEKPSSSSQGVRCVNFITGAGGLLQSVIFGYGGVRLRRQHLGINPYVLPNTTSWNIKGLSYHGFTINITIEPNAATVTLTGRPRNGKDIILNVPEQELKVPLWLEKSVTFVRHQATLTVQERTVKTKRCPTTSSARGTHQQLIGYGLASILLLLHLIIFPELLFFR